MKELINQKEKIYSNQIEIKKEKKIASNMREIPFLVMLLDCNGFLPIGAMIHLFVSTFIFLVNSIIIGNIYGEIIGVSIGIIFISLYLMLAFKIQSFVNKKKKEIKELRKQDFKKYDLLVEQNVNEIKKYNNMLVNTDLEEYKKLSFKEFYSLSEDETSILSDYKALLEDTKKGKLYNFLAEEREEEAILKNL